MIIADDRGTVVASANVAPTAFKIKNSRKAFEILSAGLYSDKVRAIIRELGTNAADAHSACGKSDVPFEVHLPNHIEPWFAVKDFGTGLSDDAVMNVYTTYFESDKTDSNDFTGCLGLGSKSPFSYTDSFTVESRVNGVKRIYSAFLDENKMPAIAKMGEEGTEESNGLTITFPVKSHDFSEFENTAGSVYRWFKVRPTTNIELEYIEPSYLFKNDKFAVLLAGSYEGSHVVMGNVAYPIKASDFCEEERLRKLVEWGVELYVQIGDVDISASREKLSYIPSTKKFLREKCEIVLKELGEEVMKSIAAKPTLWSARQELHKVNKSFSGFGFNALWNGEEIKEYANTSMEVEVDEPDGTKKKTQKHLASVEMLSVKSYNRGRFSVSCKNVYKISADNTPVYLLEKNGLASIRHMMRTKGYGYSVYVIREYDPTWLVSSGVAEVAVKSSSLPKPPRAVTVRGSVQKAKIYKFRGSGRLAGDCWKITEHDISEGGIYVEISHFKVKETHPCIVLSSPISYLEELTGDDVVVYGVRPGDVEFLKKNGEWTEFSEYAKEKIEEYDSLKESLIKAEAYGRLVSSYGYSSFRIENGLSEFAKPDSLIGEFIAKVTEGSSLASDSKLKAYKWLCAQFMNSPIEYSDDSLIELKEKIMLKYPMLKLLKSAYMDDEDKAVVSKYIEMIDSQPQLILSNV